MREGPRNIPARAARATAAQEAIIGGNVLKLPLHKDTRESGFSLSPTVLRMIAGEPSERNRVLLLLLYGAGLRVSELRHLRCRDLQERGDAGQASVLGKGGMTRTVLLPRSVWLGLTALTALRGKDEAVFVPLKSGALSASHRCTAS